MAEKIYAERYEIIEEVGQGGMATVYRALDRRLDRTVALKVMHPFLAGKEHNRRRFHREAQVVGKLEHDNIVQIYDYSGINSREAFIVSEFIDGETLRDFVEGAPGLLLTEIAAMMLHPLARALGYAHDNGVIHRDVKLENVMVRKDGVIKLTDFGIAQVLDTEQMTTTGTMVGSPAFMSPEHIEGGTLDQRADIFSLGTIAYKLACGELPFQGTPHALLRNILEVRYAPPERLNPAIGPGFARMIRTCLMRDPADRYGNCHELGAELERFITAADLGKPEGELPRFFHAPASYSAALRERLVEREIGEGRRAAAGGSIAAAMRHLDRALALDEGRKDVMELAGRLRRRQIRRQRLGSAVRWVGGGLAVGALISGLVFVGMEILQDPETGPPKAAAVATNGEVDPGREPVEDPSKLAERSRATVDPIMEPEPPRPADSAPLPRFDYEARLQRVSLSTGAQMDRIVAGALAAQAARAAHLKETIEAPVSPSDPVKAYTEIRKVAPIRPELIKGGRPPKRDGTAGGPEAEVVMREVTIMVTPPAAEIWVNGIKRGSGKVRDLALPVGVHNLRLHHPSCEVCADVERTLKVRADRPGPVIKEKIRFKPAVLLVTCPRAGQVFLDGVPAGRVGREIRTPMDTHKPQAVDIKVLFDDEYDAYDGRTRISAGRRAVVHIP